MAISNKNNFKTVLFEFSTFSRITFTHSFPELFRTLFYVICLMSNFYISIDKKYLVKKINSKYVSVLCFSFFVSLYIKLVSYILSFYTRTYGCMYIFFINFEIEFRIKLKRQIYK